MRILSRWSAAVLAAVVAFGTIGTKANAQVPTPESVLGYQAGADFHLASYDESLTYFRRLAESSDRVQLMEVGKTSEGRDWYIALISSAENLANIERYKEISLRLAHPDGLTDDEARALAREGKAIVHIDGGLHATEVAGAQHTMQFAYDLVSGDSDPEIRADSRQRDPAALVRNEPGRAEHGVGVVSLESGYPVRSVTDAGTVPEVRRTRQQPRRLHAERARVAGCDPRDTGVGAADFLQPPPDGAVPGANLDTSVCRAGFGLRSPAHVAPGKPVGHVDGSGPGGTGPDRCGAHGIGFDDWYPGFIDHAHSFHNVTSFLTETGLYRYATPHFYTVSDFPASARDSATSVALCEPMDGWVVAVARRGGLYGHGLLLGG